MQTTAIKKLFLTLPACLFMLPVFSKIYVNEISGNDKWLEIYNSGDAAVDLTGYRIEKIDEDNLSEYWAIPDNTTILAKSFLSWTQDKDDAIGATFTWGISAKKDVAFRVWNATDNENAEDYFEIRGDLYSEGLSRTVGRKTDGASELVIFKNGGTKGASNNNGEVQEATGNTKKIFVNEINGNRYTADGTTEQNKWLEIYNAEEEDVDISGYYIQKINEKGTVNNWFIPSGTTIASKGFLVWEQEEFNTDGSTFTWGISARKYLELRIFDTNQTVLDEFIVDGGDEDTGRIGDLYSEGEGRTVGREYDGAEKLVVFNTPTKKASNGTPPSGLNETNTNELTAFVNANILHLSQNVSTVTIYTISGISVLHQSVTNDKIDLSHLPKGIYIVKTKSTNNRENIQKIILME